MLILHIPHDCLSSMIKFFYRQIIYVGMAWQRNLATATAKPRKLHYLCSVGGGVGWGGGPKPKLRNVEFPSYILLLTEGFPRVIYR